MHPINPKYYLRHFTTLQILPAKCKIPLCLRKMQRSGFDGHLADQRVGLRKQGGSPRP